MNYKILITIIFLGSFFSACEDSIKGELIKNIPPETYTVVDTIIRPGDQRLKTQVEIKWWGDDPDGYITAFEISFDNKNWVKTVSQDSIFLLEIPDGSDTFDFAFYVRSIDNNNEFDPTPAKLIYPVKNSAPSVQFVYSTSNPRRKPGSSFPVLKFSWKGNDPDGIENLNHYEICLNDTTQSTIIIGSDYSSLILEGDKNSFDSASISPQILLGSSLTKHNKTISGLKLNDSNQLYIRAVDIVGEKSAFVPSYKIYVKKPNADVLLVNAYSKSIENAEQFYVTNLNANGITQFDILRLNEVENGVYTQLAPDNITQGKIFEYFNTIIWFGKDVSYSLSLAQRSTSEFFNNGGKLFMAVEIASSIDQQAGYLDFTPIDSLVNIPKGVNGFRIERDSILPAINDWPVLKASKIISSARPFYENVNSTTIYNAKIVKTGSFGKQPWEGHSTVIAKVTNAGKANFIISSLELQNLNGFGNISELFKKIFVDELEL